MKTIFSSIIVSSVIALTTSESLRFLDFNTDINKMMDDIMDKIPKPNSKDMFNQNENLLPNMKNFTDFKMPEININPKFIPNFNDTMNFENLIPKFGNDDKKQNNNKDKKNKNKKEENDDSNKNNDQTGESKPQIVKSSKSNAALPSQDFFIDTNSSLASQIGTIDVSLNQDFTIVLAGTKSTGFSWVLNNKSEIDQKCLNALNLNDASSTDDYIKIENDSVGTIGNFRFKFHPLSKGQTKLIFAYKRLWEDKTATLLTLNVNILDN